MAHRIFHFMSKHNKRTPPTLNQQQAKELALFLLTLLEELPQQIVTGISQLPPTSISSFYQQLTQQYPHFSENVKFYVTAALMDYQKLTESGQCDFVPSLLIEELASRFHREKIIFERVLNSIPAYLLFDYLDTQGHGYLTIGKLSGFINSFLLQGQYRNGKPQKSSSTQAHNLVQLKVKNNLHGFKEVFGPGYDIFVKRVNLQNWVEMVQRLDISSIETASEYTGSTYVYLNSLLHQSGDRLEEKTAKDNYQIIQNNQRDLKIVQSMNDFIDIKNVSKQLVQPQTESALGLGLGRAPLTQIQPFQVLNEPKTQLKNMSTKFSHQFPRYQQEPRYHESIPENTLKLYPKHLSKEQDLYWTHTQGNPLPPQRRDNVIEEPYGTLRKANYTYEEEFMRERQRLQELQEEDEMQLHMARDQKRVLDNLEEIKMERIRNRIQMYLFA